jgi:hypothetical protein
MLVQVKTLKQLFQRYRRPGNFVFASLFLVLSLFLLSQIDSQTVWKSGTKFLSQPAFWPIISILCMTVFAALNWISAFVSPKIEGRWKEVAFWLKSLEYIVWFMAYVYLVPTFGYLLSTVLFAVLLAFREGYRTTKMLSLSAAMAFTVVLVFKTFLQVKLPGGQIYELLPDATRAFMLTYF